MAGGIFISYRRGDARHAAGRLVDRLSRTYAPQQIFLDIDSIEPGMDFRTVLAEKVQACDVMLILIGPGWLVSSDERGGRRLDNPEDFVRAEIETALERGIRVIPVLVDGARMPTEVELPEILRPLSYRNAVRLAHERFAADAEDLTRELTRIVAPTKIGRKNAAQTDKQTTNETHPRQELTTGISEQRRRRLAAIFALLAVFVTVLSTVLLGVLTGFAFLFGAMSTCFLRYTGSIANSGKPRVAITAAAVVVALVSGILYFVVLTRWLGFVPVSAIVIDSLVALCLGAATGWAYSMIRAGSSS